MRFNYTAISLALVATLSACGGSGSDDTSTPTTPTTPTTGFSFVATEMITNLTDDV
ncbi:iron-regulated protein A precursor, partial [Shewanella sp. 11B5]